MPTFQHVVRLCAGASVALSALMGGAPSGLADSFTLRIAAGHPKAPLPYVTQAADYFVPTVTRRIEAETGHSVRFIEGYAGTMANLFEVLESTQKGLVDIGLWCTCFEPTKAFPHNFSYFMPFATDDPRVQTRLTNRIYDEFPKLTEVLPEKYGQKWLAVGSIEAYGLGTTFAWKEPEDLRGHKIAGAGPNLPWIERMGAAPVQTDLNEAYNAMQSGVYEGLIMFPGTWIGFKFYEVARHFTQVGWGSLSVVEMSINGNTWEKLPEDVRRIIADEARAWAHENDEDSWNRHQGAIEKLQELGSNVRRLPRSERLEMAKDLGDWPDRKAKEIDAVGFPGTEMFKRYLDLAEADSEADLIYRYPISTP